MREARLSGDRRDGKFRPVGEGLRDLRTAALIETQDNSSTDTSTDEEKMEEEKRVQKSLIESQAT